MKRAQRILEAASRRLDLPGEIVAGLPRVDLVGFSQLTIERHRGILAYSTEKIVIAVGIGDIQICGSSLSISLLNQTYVTVSGNVTQILLLPGTRHE